MSFYVMNPLLALLAPQAAVPSGLPVSAAVNIGSAGSNAISISGGGNAAVQVDSSSFLNILATSAYANGSSQDLISGLQNGAQGQLNKFSDTQLTDLVAQLAKQNGIDDTPENLLTQGTAGKSISTITSQPLVSTDSLPQDGSGVNAANLPTTSSTSSIKTVAETLIGGEGGTPPATVAPAQTSPTSVEIASNTNSLSTVAATIATAPEGQVTAPVLNNPVLNNIVRPNSSSNGLKSTLTNSSNDRKSVILTGSRKLLNQLEGVNNNSQPTTNADSPDVLETKGSLVQALKAYDQKEESTFPKTTTVDSAISSKASTSEAVLNNVTAVDSFKNSELTQIQSPKQAHHSVPTPAKQASIKIANAINNGTKHITIQLDPAKLGQMEVKMELAQEGTSKLIVYIEKAETLNLIQRDSGILEKVLQDAGFKTDSGSLSFNLRDGGNAEGGGENFANSGSGNRNNDEMARNDNLNPGIEYRMDLSDGVVDITI